MITKEKKEQIISSVDLRSYLNSRGITFNNQNKTNCPFPDHGDSTPSFSIVDEEQYFHCFGCDRGGDIINFVREFDGVGFYDALKIVADYAGIPIQDNEQFSEEDKRKYKEFELIKDIFKDAAEYCHKVMPQDITEHLKDHYGFTEKFIEDVLIGYDDGKLYKHLSNLGYTEEELLKTGLFYENYHNDVLKTRILFWYWKRGKPVYVIGRETHYTKERKNYKKGAKYMKLLTHSKRFPYVSEMVQNDYIYNEDVCLNPGKRPNYVIITEGITDAMIAQMKGIPVISPVTTKFKDDDIQKLKMLVKYIDHVFIANDNEENGQGLKGAFKTAETLNRDSKDVQITLLPRDENQKKVDLNMFLQGKTKKEFESYLSNNSYSYQSLLLKEAVRHEERGEKEKYKELRRKLFIIADSLKPIPQDELFSEMSNKLNMNKGVIRKQYKAVVEEEKNKPEARESESFAEELKKGKDESEDDAQRLFKLLLDEGAKFYKRDDINPVMILNGKHYDIAAEENAFTMLIMRKYGLNYIEYKVKKIIWSFKVKASAHSTLIKQQTWLYYKKRKNTLYLGTGGENLKILKLDPTEIKEIYNGEDDGIFIPDSNAIMETWSFKRDIDKEKVAKDLHDLFVDFTPLNKSDSLLTLFVILSVALKRESSTTPLLKIHGESSSGKTQIAKSIVNLFYGNESAVGDMTDASKFDQASKRPLMVLDNKESVSREALEQFLLYAGSGATHEKRDTSSQTGTIKQIIDTLCIITGIHPFEKKELLNRSIDLIANKKYHNNKRDIQSVNEELAERRDEFLSLWVILTWECLKKKDEIKEKRNKIHNKFKKHFKERLNGYYAIMWQMAEEMLPLVGYTKEEIQKLAFGWVDKQSKLGTLNEKETSEVFNYLNTLATYIRNGKDEKFFFEDSVHDRQSNDITIETTGRDLLTAFRMISKDTGTRLPFSSTQQLMARLKNDMDILKDHNWVITLSQRKVSGDNVHELYHKFETEETEEWGK